MAFTPAPPLPLASGDQMDRETFHRLYEPYAETGPKVELIGGVVFVSSPSRGPHAEVHGVLAAALGLYVEATPGCAFGVDAGIMLADDSQPAPDLFLRRRTGGSSNQRYDHWIVGAPELLIEVAHASHALDLHGKRIDYQRHGVSEYVVVTLHSREVYHFDFAGGEEALLNAGVLRSVAFPGLWIDVSGAIAHDVRAVCRCARQGLESPAHAAFLAGLNA